MDGMSSLFGRLTKRGGRRGVRVVEEAKVGKWKGGQKWRLCGHRHWTKLRSVRSVRSVWRRPKSESVRVRCCGEGGGYSCPRVSVLSIPDMAG